MPKIIKWILWVLAAFALYMSIKILLPYIRFADIKGKMEEAVGAASAETDDNIADKLSENAILDKLPISGDYFYQVVGEDGKRYIYEPESPEQVKEYQELAKQYFLEHMTRTSRGLVIEISYTVEIYFPFNIYIHRILFVHKEGETQQQ